MRAGVLYFPTLRFHSREWLCSSLLVWDHVYRIVPAGFPLDDPPEVRIAVDAGLVRDISPSPADRAAAMSCFEAFWDRLGDVPAGFADEGATEAVLLEKIDERLYPLLEDVAVSMSGDVAQLPRPMARAYMMILAQQMSRRRSLAMATDNPDAWVVDAYVREDGEFDEYVVDDDAAYQYCHIGVAPLLPVDVRNVSVKDVVELAGRTGEERAEFRRMVHEFLAETARCQDEAHAVQVARDFREGLEQRVSSVAGQLKRFKRSAFPPMIGAGVPVLAGILPVLFPGKEAALPVAAGMCAVSVVAALAANYKVPVLDDKVGAYFVGLQKTARRSGITHFQEIMEEFIND